MLRSTLRTLIDLTVVVGVVAGGGLGCATTNSADCASICEKLETCDSTTDELECRESCESDQGYNLEYWAARKVCLETLSCTEIGGAADLECMDSGTSELLLTSAATTLCEDMGETLATCDGDVDGSIATDSCTETVRVYSDPFTSALRGCYDASCNDIQGCLLDTADRFRVDEMRGVYSPVTAPIATWTPATLLARLELARAEACVCSGACDAIGPATADLVECYQGVYQSNPDAYQAALDCHGAVAREMEACNRAASGEEGFADCVGLGNAMQLDCPSYDGLFEACGSCDGGGCAALPTFTCE